MVRRVSEEDKTIVEGIKGALEHGNPAIITTTWADGTDIAVLTNVGGDGDGMVDVHVLAILVTDEIFRKIVPPA